METMKPDKEIARLKRQLDTERSENTRLQERLRAKDNELDIAEARIVRIYHCFLSRLLQDIRLSLKRWKEAAAHCESTVAFLADCYKIYGSHFIEDIGSRKMISSMISEIILVLLLHGT